MCSAALSRVTGTALLRLAGADLLPFEFTSTATTLRGYVDEVAKLQGTSNAVDLGPLRDALTKLLSAAQDYEKAVDRFERSNLATGAPSGGQLGELNRILYRSERAFRHEAGLPRREWFKHLIYAPGFYTGYGVKTLPGIREGIEQAHWDEARSFVPVVAQSIARLTSDVNQATEALKKIVR